MSRRGAGARVAAATMAAALLLAAAPGVRATRFYDVADAVDPNRVTVVDSYVITLPPGAAWVELVLPRAESMPSGGEIAAFRQEVEVTYDGTPPPDLVDRSEWYTRLTWLPGTVAGPAEIDIVVRSESDAWVDLPGVAHDLSRRPADYYTSPTATIQYVPGIAEAIGALARDNGVPGVPPGDLGVAQRWMAFLVGTLGAVPPAAGAPQDAAAAWAAGTADGRGLANVFASGLRSLGIPACVAAEARLPGGAYTAEVDAGIPRGGTGYWAGAWSEGLGAFLPVDLAVGEFGFLSAQRQPVVYLEDLSDGDLLLVTEAPGAGFRRIEQNLGQSSAGVRYPQRAVRRLDDGYPIHLLAQAAVGFQAPGGTSSVPDSGRTAPREWLRASHPFSEVLVVSVRLVRGGRADVDVCDVTGRRVASLARGRDFPAGENFLRWSPGRAASGVYFVRAAFDDGRRLSARAVRRP